ncbi:hypothetical protein E2320_011781 [Naja naja]|nr:hypothetical protein E2320_011781 [Naja naja]
MSNELNAWMETAKPSRDSVGFDAVKPDFLLSLDDQVFRCQEPKVENASEPNGSAFGELAGDLGLVDQEAPAQVQEERKTTAPKSSGEGMNLGPSGVICPTQEEEKEGSQMSSIPVGRARRAALNVVTSLAEVSPEDVVSSLLKHSLPCNRRTPKSCGAIQGFYPTLFLAILTQIHFLVQLPGYVEEEEVEVEEEEEEEEGQTHQTAGSGGRANSQPPFHGKQAVTEHKNKGWGLLSSKEEHLRGVVLLARILATNTNHHLLGLLAEVIPQLDAQEAERALTAKALFAGVS